MTKIIGWFTTILIASFFLLGTARAATIPIAGASASIASNHAISMSDSSEYITQKRAIEKILVKYNSPMAGEADTFIYACHKYHLDCYLLPAIAGLESGFGNMIYPGTYNAFGWGGGMIYFKNWNEAIMTVAKGLRENYYNRGAVTVSDIGYMYAAGSTTWAGKAYFYMNQIKQGESQVQVYNLPL